MRSKVMKLSWQISKESYEKVTFSSCLKIAWQIVKTEGFTYFNIDEYRVTWYFNNNLSSKWDNLEQYNPYALTGTRKQIKWATDIITELENNCSELIKHYKKLNAQVSGKNKFFESYPIIMKNFLNIFFEKLETKSADIINKRNEYTSDKMDNLVKKELNRFGIKM